MMRNLPARGYPDQGLQTAAALSSECSIYSLRAAKLVLAFLWPYRGCTAKEDKVSTAEPAVDNIIITPRLDISIYGIDAQHFNSEHFIDSMAHCEILHHILSV